MSDADDSTPAQDSLFQSGWRPALGWVLAASIFLYFVPRYLIGTAVWVVRCLHTDALVPYPIDDTGLWQLATILLGSSAIRSADKFLGTAKH